jgi:hypothetical protein
MKNPNDLVLDYINRSNNISASDINKILYNQKVSITENKLKILLNIKSVEFELPIKQDINKIFTNLVKGFAGVYVFTHISTGSKYVGSSNLLNRRLDYYFNNNLPKVGKLLPLISKDGIKAFKLKLYILDKNKFKDIDVLFLEQYFLLDKIYNLNTLKVVNFGPQLGKSSEAKVFIFINFLTLKKMYYTININLQCNYKLFGLQFIFLGLFLLSA